MQKSPSMRELRVNQNDLLRDMNQNDPQHVSSQDNLNTDFNNPPMMKRRMTTGKTQFGVRVSGLGAGGAKGNQAQKINSTKSST